MDRRRFDRLLAAMANQTLRNRRASLQALDFVHGSNLGEAQPFGSYGSRRFREEDWQADLMVVLRPITLRIVH